MATPITAETPRPIMLRAYLTDAEYENLRVLAIREGVNTSALVSDALRATYNLNGEAK